MSRMLSRNNKPNSLCKGSTQQENGVLVVLHSILVSDVKNYFFEDKPLRILEKAAKKLMNNIRGRSRRGDALQHEVKYDLRVL